MTGRFQLCSAMAMQIHSLKIHYLHRASSVFAQKNQRVYRQRALRRNPGSQETEQQHCHDNTS
jgi:hypothetical protein